ncbi:MAG: AbrB family transcriptional regulator [Betaproteobacteria bacterium RIFCSPLOWO2_02_FULL_65_24]|nr:MAG: AbrB family transcriptional regulator [Betaproteobacteria bacterium RIFCSPLOWO2_02_FULL_65_24]
MPTAVVTSKGQITLPKGVREALGVEAGDRVDFIETGKGVFAVVAATRDVRELKGMIPRPKKPVSIEDMRRAVARTGRKSARRSRRSLPQSRSR